MGYFDKLEDESLAIRNLAGIVMKVAGAKEELDKVWPLKSEPVKIKSFASTGSEMITAIINATKKLEKDATT